MELPGNSEFTPQFFDESKKAWLENKVRYGHSYLYKCIYIHSNKKQCRHGATHSDFCKRHFILTKSQNNPKNNFMKINHLNNHNI
jgi:hypothetical protein